MTDSQLEIINYLSLLWNKHSVLRFNQLITTLQYDFTMLNPNYNIDGKPDLFYLEDDKFLEYLKVKVEE